MTLSLQPRKRGNAAILAFIYAKLKRSISVIPFPRKAGEIYSFNHLHIHKLLLLFIIIHYYRYSLLFIIYKMPDSQNSIADN